MTFELIRMGWPNSAAIMALALLPLVAIAGGAASPMPAAEPIIGMAATSCPATGEVLALLNAGGPALPPARS
jgi:hypothetical protein